MPIDGGFVVTLRVCPVSGCPALVTSGRCPAHQREHDARRGRRQARGYDAAYDAERRDWQARLDDGALIWCWRCDELGKPHQVSPSHWHLGHDNADRSIIRGPQCPESNLRDAGRRPPPPR